jgi:YVTN family beta-propeller protein
MTGTATTVTAGTYPWAVAVNPVTNKIYVANYNSNNVTMIDGATNAKTTVPVGSTPQAVAVNPVTNKIYVANRGTNNVTVIDDAPVSDSKVLAIMDSLPNHTTDLARPTLSGRAVNRQRPGHTGIWSVQNFLNTCQFSWNQASISSGAGSDSVMWTWNWGTDSLIMGENLLCAVAFDSIAATTNNSGLGTPYAGNCAVYPVYRMEIPSRISSSGLSVPGAFSFINSSGTVRYSLPLRCRVSLKYYDLRGRLTASLVNSEQGPGYYTVRPGKALSANGALIMVFEAGSFVKKELVVMAGR